MFDMTSKKIDKRKLIYDWRFDKENKLYDLSVRNGNLKTKQCIGDLDVSEENDHFVLGSFLSKKYRGQGIGFKMYEYALRKLGCISTTFDLASPRAQGIWISLMRRYEFQYECNFLDPDGQMIITVYNKKRNPIIRKNEFSSLKLKADY